MKTVNLLNTILKDDDNEYGGTSKDNELLQEFLDEAEVTYDTDIEIVNKLLIESGIKPIIEQNTEIRFSHLVNKLSDNGFEIFYYSREQHVEIFHIKSQEDIEMFVYPIDQPNQELDVVDLENYKLTELEIIINNKSYVSPALETIYEEIISIF